MRLSSLTFARYNYDTAWNLNYRTNNGSLSTFIVDTKNGLTSFAARNVYDGNGNMVTNNNNHNVLVYDDENQLTRYFHYQNNFANIVAGDTRSDFIYDGLARLRKRIEWVVSCNAGQSAQGAGAVPNSGGGGNGCTWGEVSETWYVYDGRRVIQERDSNNVPTVSYTRGNDLSVSLEGAGGIGGLLARSSGYSSGNWTSHADYYADGNGNITSLIDSNQAVVASYRYDPFGNTISKSGGLGDANVYRFSSKEVHVNSGMYYYGFRFYDPNLQRWINRDPIQEGGGVNLYSFARNCAIGFIDVFGDSGTLTINTTGAGSSECAAGTGSKIGHAWITYTPDNGETTSYGTWGRGTFAPSDPGGLHHNGEKTKGYRPDATVSAHLTDAQEQSLLNLVNAYYQQGSGAWRLNNPCTSFAADAWKAATGDNLSTGLLNFPNTLHDSIQRAVTYQFTSPVVVVPVSPTSNVVVNAPVINLPRP